MRERFIRWLIRVLKVKGVHLHRDPIRKEKPFLILEEIRKEKANGNKGSFDVAEPRNNI